MIINIQECFSEVYMGNPSLFNKLNRRYMNQKEKDSLIREGISRFMNLNQCQELVTTNL